MTLQTQIYLLMSLLFAVIEIVLVLVVLRQNKIIQRINEMQEWRVVKENGPEPYKA